MVGDLLLEGAALKVDRPDLQAIFGGGASSWGFTTLFVTPSPAVISGSTRLVLTKNGTVLRTLNAGDLPLKQSAGENHSHQAFKAAVAAANTGSVIEIGSRAQSGNVRRNWFPAHFDYLGIDIA